METSAKRSKKADGAVRGVRTLADIGLTPARAYGLYQCSEESTWIPTGGGPMRIGWIAVDGAITSGDVRVLYEKFSFLVVLVTNAAAFRAQLECSHHTDTGTHLGGYVLGLAWRTSEEGKEAHPEVRTLGFVDELAGGKFRDWVWMCADNAPVGFLPSDDEEAA